MNEAYFRMKDYRSCLDVLARLALSQANALENQYCAYDIFDTGSVYNDWEYQWHRVKSECKDEKVKVS